MGLATGPSHAKRGWLMTDWRSRWDAVVASDVSARDGLGWEFTSRTGDPAWAVFREDSGPFPVFSAARGHIMPSAGDLAAMTHEAVADLLAAAGLADQHGWITENISAALLLASMSVESWEGVEWALESGPDDVAIAWAEPDAARTPYAWLRAIGADASAEVSVYQDDALFGLCFIPTVELRLPEFDSGSLRSRRGIPHSCRDPPSTVADHLADECRASPDGARPAAGRAVSRHMPDTRVPPHA